MLHNHPKPKNWGENREKMEDGDRQYLTNKEQKKIKVK